MEGKAPSGPWMGMRIDHAHVACAADFARRGQSRGEDRSVTGSGEGRASGRRPRRTGGAEEGGVGEGGEAGDDQSDRRGPRCPGLVLGAELARGAVEVAPDQLGGAVARVVRPRVVAPGLGDHLGAARGRAPWSCPTWTTKVARPYRRANQRRRVLDRTIILGDLPPMGPTRPIITRRTNDFVNPSISGRSPQTEAPVVFRRDFRRNAYPQSHLDGTIDRAGRSVILMASVPAELTLPSDLHPRSTASGRRGWTVSRRVGLAVVLGFLARSRRSPAAQYGDGYAPAPPPPSRHLRLMPIQPGRRRSTPER